jgi:type II secretory pathway component PulF
MNLIDKLKGQDLDVLLNQLLKPRSNKLTFEERSKLYSRVRRLVLAGKEYYGALNIIRELTSQRKQTLEIKKRLAVYDMAVQRMRERNVGLGEALAGAIPESEKNLITAAESGSNIEVGLNAAMMISKLSGDIKKAVMMAVLYPAIIFLVIIGGIAFFGQSVLPEFASFMPVDQWSPMGQKLYHLSTTVHIWAPITLGIIFSAVAAYRWSVHKWVGEKREKVDDAIVFYNINKTIQSSIVLISLSAYLQSGIWRRLSIFRVTEGQSERRWLYRCLMKSPEKILRFIAGQRRKNSRHHWLKSVKRELSEHWKE